MELNHGQKIQNWRLSQGFTNQKLRCSIIDIENFIYYCFIIICLNT